MNKTKIYYKKVKLHNPILVVGLPGIGNVGNLVAQYLIQKLNAKKFATLYSHHLPYFVIAEADGTFRLVSNRFYYYKNKKGSDIVILTGDYQPATSEGQYDISEKVVLFFKSLGGKKVFTIGGYSAGETYIQNPRVFGVAGDKATINELSKQGVIFGAVPNLSIIGAAGLVAAFAKKHKLKVACIMGETGMLEVDANSAKSVLNVLSKILGIEIDLKDLEALQKETEKFIKSLEEASKANTGDEFPNYIK